MCLCLHSEKASIERLCSENAAIMKFNRSFEHLAKPKTLATKLTAKAENYVQQAHPWVFNESIVKISDDAKTGDLAIIFGKRKNTMIGIGLYDADSSIRIKMIYSGALPVKINSDFFQRKIENAYRKREPLLRTKTTSYRLLFGENDGFPSFIADVYDNVLVIKLYSEIWLPYLETLVESLISVSKVVTVVMRLSRNLQQSNTHDLVDGEVIYGSLKSEIVFFIEHSVQFFGQCHQRAQNRILFRSSRKP